VFSTVAADPFRPRPLLAKDRHAASLDIVCAQMPPDHSSIAFNSFRFAIKGQNEKTLLLLQYERRRARNSPSDLIIEKFRLDS
jgi:hypothetical protein